MVGGFIVGVVCVLVFGCVSGGCPLVSPLAWLVLLLIVLVRLSWVHTFRFCFGLISLVWVVGCSGLCLILDWFGAPQMCLCVVLLGLAVALHDVLLLLV